MLLVAALAQARHWLAGRPAAVDVGRGLAALPRRYLVHVHEAVHRDPVSASIGPDSGARSALMHALTAGGFLAASVLIVVVHVVGVVRAAAAWALLAALAVMAAGVALEFLRRVVHGAPARLAHGAFDRLPWALAAFVIFFARVTLPPAGFGAPIDWGTPAGVVWLALGAFACFELYAGLAAGPMRHALCGALHLICHPRPARFAGGGPDTAVRPLDLSAARLGAERPGDFDWNQLLGFDACVQCGRCEAACPAFAAGQPLSPRELIRSLAAAGRGHGRARPIVGTAVEPEALWACTTCRACVYECPMMIEHVDAVTSLRRFETLERGATPAKAADALEVLRTTDTIGGRALSARLHWAADLNLVRLADVGRCDVLLWIGEGGFELRNQRTLRAVVRLMRAAGVDFAVLGEEELDCGDVARRLGDEATFVDLARRNIATLERYAFERIVTTDPHVLHVIRSEYPALGGHFTIEHHTTFLAGLLRTGRLAPAARKAAPLTYHDPCYLGRYQGEFDAPRRILGAIGTDLREMPRSRERSSCCGWGGGAAFTDVPGKRRVPDVRIEHARAAGAGTVAVACPNCAVMLEGVVAPRPEIADVAELLWEAVEGGA